MSDFDDLYEILSDPESMAYYPHPFSVEETKEWIQWCLDSYKKHSCGLWAVIHKESNECIGDCGITTQLIEGEALREIGYHIKKAYWGNGLATEAAIAARKYGFKNLGFDRIVSYMRVGNFASRRVAEKNGMSVVKEFTKTGARQVLYEIRKSNKLVESTEASSATH